MNVLVTGNMGYVGPVVMRHLDGTRAMNPAFEVTPSALITALVTDRRCVRLADASGLPGRGTGPHRC
jgi:methylthioribose-1-phosphate isomerase